MTANLLVLETVSLRLVTGGEEWGEGEEEEVEGGGRSTTSVPVAPLELTVVAAGDSLQVCGCAQTRDKKLTNRLLKPNTQTTLYVSIYMYMVYIYVSDSFQSAELPQ